MGKVIIDKIDVSECRYLFDDKNKKNLCSITLKNCKYLGNDCYYKQLKRKEQECEKLKWLLETKCQSEWEKENAELKAENSKLKTDIGIYKGIIDADKVENAELKEQLNRKDDLINDITNGGIQLQKECERLKEENEQIKKDYAKLHIDFAKCNEENERLKETEEEISDFISDISTCGFRYDDRCPDNLDELQQCIEDLCNKFDNYKQALQEIREIAREWLNNDWSCFNCRNNMHDKLQDILTKINEVMGVKE